MKYKIVNALNPQKISTTNKNKTNHNIIMYKNNPIQFMFYKRYDCAQNIYLKY